jgi:hypothetical protein
MEDVGGGAVSGGIEVIMDGIGIDSHTIMVIGDIIMVGMVGIITDTIGDILGMVDIGDVLQLRLQQQLQRQVLQQEQVLSKNLQKK